jgi:hypothetical protein
MADAKRDQNRVTTKQAVLDSDGVTLINIVVNSNTGGVKMTYKGTSLAGSGDAKRDSNGVPSMLGVSTTNSKVTVPLKATSNGAILIQ